MEITQKKSQKGFDRLLNISSYAIFILVVSVLFYSLLRYYILSKGEEPKEDKTVSEEVENSTWVIYKNDEYGYSFEYPLYLLSTEVKNTEKYLSFVTFEETSFSTLKGVAVGITDRTLEDELSYIKDSFAGVNDANLKESKDGQTEGKRFYLLTYETSGSEDLEDKSIFIINDGRYTMSISTVPEQMEHIINSLKFF